ncbi:MAG: hypothetical protein ACTS73_06275 [Arsenophonus sp. NEOnobi-MAG3]
MILIYILKELIPLYPVNIVTLNMLSGSGIFVRVTSDIVANSRLQENI